MPSPGAVLQGSGRGRHTAGSCGAGEGTEGGERRTTVGGGSLMSITGSDSRC